MEYQVAQLCLPPKISTSALYTAIEEKHWEQACDLMDYCENECLFKFEEKWNGWTALHKACFHRSIPIELFHDLLDLTLCTLQYIMNARGIFFTVYLKPTLKQSTCKTTTITLHSTIFCIRKNSFTPPLFAYQIQSHYMVVIMLKFVS